MFITFSSSKMWKNRSQQQTSQEGQKKTIPSQGGLQLCSFSFDSGEINILLESQIRLYKILLRA